MKKTYSTPKLIDLGSVRQVTLGLKDGDSTDAVFPTNTPKKNLLFS